MDWQIFWTVLGGAFGGALIGALATILVTRMNHKHEHQKWLRQEKLSTYTDFMRIVAALEDFGQFKKLTSNEQHELKGKINTTLTRIDLLAPPAIAKLCATVRGALGSPEDSPKRSQLRDGQNNLRKAMRSDIQLAKKHKMH